MEIILIGSLTFFAALVGTVTGFGTSMIMVPVLAMFFPPLEAIFFVAIIHLFNDVWKVALFRAWFHGKLIILFGVTGIIGSYIGASFSVQVDQFFLARALGAFLIGYAGFLIYHSKFKVTPTSAIAVAGGAISGFSAGLIGIGGAVRGAFISAFDLPKAVYIATAGAIGIMIDSTRIIAYAVNGVGFPPRLWWGMLLFIPLSFLGAEAAKKIVDRISQRTFRMVIALFLFAVGIKLLLFP